MNRDWDQERRPYNEQTLGPAGETLQSMMGCVWGDPTINDGMCSGRPYNKQRLGPSEETPERTNTGTCWGDPTINVGMCHGRPYNQHWDVPWETLQEILG